MNFQDFQESALRTECAPTTLNYGQKDLRLLLELLVTAGKVADLAKKTIAYNKPMNVEMMKHLTNKLSVFASTVGATAPEGLGEDSSLRAVNLRILHGAIGMFGEAGELLEAVGNQQVTGHLDMVNVSEEIGDTQWYAAIVVDECGVGMDRILKSNIAKLSARYPDKFSIAACENRDLAAERVALEAN